jgi:F1F0 ATPase subunit 2
MTTEAGSLVLSLLAGILLGIVFFGGLWWTCKRGLASPRVAYWFIASFLVRTGVTLYGFYFTAGGHWERFLICLLGFFAVRVAARIRAGRLPPPVPLTPEARHAP